MTFDTSLISVWLWPDRYKIYTDIYFSSVLFDVVVFFCIYSIFYSAVCLKFLMMKFTFQLNLLEEMLSLRVSFFVFSLAYSYRP